MNKGVVMGGSFNPPTLAHRKLMWAAFDAVDACHGIFVPTAHEYVEKKTWKYAPIGGPFPTHTDLGNKIGPEGQFRPFSGSTAVFRLDRDTFRLARLMQALLHRHLEDTGMLAQPLPEDSLHMTLHDLVSPEQTLSGGEGEKEYAREVENSVNLAETVVRSIQERYAGQEIVLIPDRIVNMVGKSLVLLLKPASERDDALLLELYRQFDAVKTLPYPLTPHITLAYFRPGMIDGDRLGAVVQAMQPEPHTSPVCRLYPEALMVQRFSDMARYRDIPMKLCFCCDGGMNRSVMCAHMLNHMAKERGLPLRAEARSAFQNTHGRAIPDEVWSTLERHGIEADRSFQTARYLENRDWAAFSQFVTISAGAIDRMAMLGVPDSRRRMFSGIFFGIGDPAYESSYEQAYAEILERMEQLFRLLEAKNEI